jgi:putative ABC transport system permease protein
VTVGSFILKNALRNKRRATLSVLSVAVSLFLFVTLLVALREITVPVEDVGAALRVVVRNKISIASFLPARQRPIIERIPGVEAVSPFSWFGGKYKDEQNMTFAQFAMDAGLLRKIFGEAKMSEEEYMAFEKDRTSCILGRLTADKYHLKIGDRVPITSTIYPCSIELKIAGIYSGTPDDRNLLFHHKYLDEASDQAGWVGTWWIKVSSIEEMPRVTEAINRAFANTSAEVRAETERAFQLSFISMWGNIKILVRSICMVVVFTLLLVSASTMSMAIRERFRELAILKALGFRQRELFAYILAESFGLALSGALAGVGGAWLFYTYPTVAGLVLAALGLLFLLTGVRLGISGAVLSCVLVVLAAGLTFLVAWLVYSYGDVSRITQNVFLHFEVTPRIAGQAALVAALLGIVASIAPALSVAKTSVVNGLKTLD